MVMINMQCIVNKPEPKGEKSSQAGFTLIEIIISLVIMTILTLSVGLMFAKGRGTIRGQADRRVAQAIAQHRMEEINTMVFSDFTDRDASSGDSFIFSETENPPRTSFNCSTPPCGIDMDGTGGLPDYSNYNLTTLIEYVDVIIPSVGNPDITLCADDGCPYLRCRVTASLSDLHKQSGNKGYVKDVMLETIFTSWKE
jgi:prepilin-type N-terminal cleavage/methylation domain-containing protein